MTSRGNSRAALLSVTGLALLLAIISLIISLADNGVARVAGLEERLALAEDELAIQRLLVDYSFTQDARDFAGYAALFAEEGEWVNGNLVYKGPEAIQQMLVDVYGMPPADYVNTESYHITSNPRIDLDGDRATAHSRHLLMMRGPDGQPTPMLAGYYEDEFIREAGEWKILQRVDYPLMPTPAEWREIMRARQLNQAE